MKVPEGSRTQILVRFGYDGARFHGLQPQTPDLPTAGAALIDRLTQAAGRAPKGLHFAARTDAGVHALRNLATCWLPTAAREPSARPVAQVLADVMRPRPDGLTAVLALEVPTWVHARGSSRGKRYRYL